jgi:4-amino-4-deoxychorismate lyase
MSLLFETICIKNGMPQHLLWHEQRMNLARREIWQVREPVVLGAVLIVPREFTSGVVRCNIHYGPDIQKIIFKKHRQRLIRSLKLVNCIRIDYHLKYTDRSMLESILGQRETCDEVIIVINGLITDTSVSNLIFLDGKDWVTPASPLLKGTCRNRLLSENRLIVRDIRVKDMDQFTGCKLINAMRNPDEESLIPVSEIH